MIWSCTSIRYVPGGNPQPRNGKVIGHIIDGEYVPVQKQTAADGPDILSYGASALVRSVTSDMLGELLQIYPAKDAYTIVAIASLRVIKPEIAAKRLSSEYNRTFISRFYPGLALSPNAVSSFLEKLGMDGTKRRAFYRKRADAVMEDHHIAIDGTLKQDSSKVNDLSAFSFKARTRGCKEVSVLYAYDLEAMEPICAEVFPVGSIDASSYAAFIRDNDIKKGIIVADKCFPPSKIKEELDARPDLHFLTPIKRNDVRIRNNDMLTYDGVLSGVGKHVLYKKAVIKGGRYLYAFKDAEKAAAEEAGFTCYADRWLLELVFNHYKSDERLDKTNVHGDFSVIGSEFINFVATVATCRILRKAQKAELLDIMSYGDLMDDLSSAWRKTDAPDSPRSDDGCWIHVSKDVFAEMEALGLSTPVPKPEPKKRGRPKKNPNPEADKPKRPRGRPRKIPCRMIYSPADWDLYLFSTLNRYQPRAMQNRTVSYRLIVVS